MSESSFSVKGRGALFFQCVALATLILAVYWQATGHDFVYLDDGKYVYQNQRTLSGITWDNVRWSFTSFHNANWHPLTWLSHMLDVEFFGTDPGRHHLVSVVIHAASSILLFLILRSWTWQAMPSLLSAALFAIHPLHVESVSWVAERKDVLFMFFGLLTLGAYGRYVRRPGVGRYLAVPLSFSLSLLAKPMLVTLPFLLLLLDYWPFRRIGQQAETQAEDPAVGVPAVSVRTALIEKTPLLLMATASSVLTVLAQRGGGAITSLENIPFTSRLLNTFSSYGGYLSKTLWPFNLSVYYSYPDGSFLRLQALMSALVLAGLFLFCLRNLRRRPFLMVGLLWYLGTLVPVIGIVQVGLQSMADRYTYLPLIGVFIMVSWSLAEVSERSQSSRSIVAVLSLSVIAILSVQSRLQVSYWKNSETLFSRSIEVTPESWILHGNLANYLADQGRREESLDHYRKALLCNPTMGNIYMNFGLTLSELGRRREARLYYDAVRHLVNDRARAHSNLGYYLYQHGNLEEARRHYEAALRHRPGYPPALEGLEKTSPVLRHRL